LRRQQQQQPKTTNVQHKRNESGWRIARKVKLARYSATNNYAFAHTLLTVWLLDSKLDIDGDVERVRSWFL
jgi:hypothetical protein